MPVWDDLVGPGAGERAARAPPPGTPTPWSRPSPTGEPAARGVEDDARLALHRPARLRPVHRGPRLRRRAPVRQPRPCAGRSPRLRLLRRLPHEPDRAPTPTSRSSAPTCSPSASRRPASWSAAPSCPRRSDAGRSSSWRTPTASPRARATSCSRRSRSPRPARCGCCAPPPSEDVLPTIRSRCRHPHAAYAAGGRRRRRADPAGRHRTRAWRASAARATQGHIGRARRLATDERARARRAAVLRLPLRVDDVGGCLQGGPGADRHGDGGRQAGRRGGRRQGDGGPEGGARRRPQGGRMPRGTAGVMKELEDRQKRRRTRTQRDSLDLALSDLTGFYRDVLALQFGSPDRPRQRGGPGRPGAPGPRRLTPERTLRRIEARSPRAATPSTATSRRCWRWRR